MSNSTKDKILKWDLYSQSFVNTSPVLHNGDNIYGSGIIPIKLTLDGKEMFVSSGGLGMKLFNVDTWESLQSFNSPGYFGEVNIVLLSRDGSKFWITDEKGLGEWSFAEKKLTRVISLLKRFYNLLEL
jgi:hypothetical protein